MKIRDFRAGPRGLLLAVALFASGEAAAFFTAFTGSPASITCSNTGYNMAAGVQFIWDLPFSGVPLHVVEDSAGIVYFDLVSLLASATGSEAVSPLLFTYPSTPTPYTVTVLATPVFQGASSSSFSFLCNNGVGSNFVITNGAPFGLPTIPTLDRWAIFALALLLITLSFITLRRKG